MLGLLLGLAVAATPTVGVGRVDVALDPKARLGPRSAGLLCAPNGDIHWRRDLTEADFDSAPTIILQAIGAAGLRTTGDATGLFAGVVGPADYLIGGRVTAAQGDICIPSRGAPILFGSRVTAESGAKGSLILQVEWQLYAIQSRTIVLTAVTGGQGVLPKKTPAGVRRLVHEALAASLGVFLAQPDVRSVLASTPPESGPDRHP